MDRRAFLKTGIACAAASLSWRGALAASEWRIYEVVARIDVSWPKDVSRVWLPLPMLDDTPWHRSLGSSWSGNASRTDIASDGKYGVSMLYAEWPAAEAAPRLELTSRFATRERTVDPFKARADAEHLGLADREFFTAPTDYIPTDGIVRKTAQPTCARSRSRSRPASWRWTIPGSTPRASFCSATGR